jgi:hypothetical protein
MNTLIKYKYALTSANQIVSITGINHENRSSFYYCPSCGKELRPRLGDKRVHHFYHKEVVSNNLCAIETYLHKVAKTLLYLRLQELNSLNQPYVIDLFDLLVITDSNNKVVEQKLDSTYSGYNLLEGCIRINLEKVYGTYKPDILLEYSTKEPLFIEIQVKHRSTFNKRENNDLIEVIIKDESDFERITKSLSEIPDETFNLDKYRIKKTQRSTICIIDKRELLANDQVVNSHFDCNNYITIIKNIFQNQKLQCIVEYEPNYVLGAKDRKVYTNILLNDFYSFIKVVNDETGYCELSTTNGCLKLYIGFSQKLKEIGKDHKYIILKEKEIKYNSILYLDMIMETNLSLDLAKLHDNFMLFVSCFIPRDHWKSSIREMNYKYLQQLVKDNDIGIVTIDKIRKSRIAASV